MAQIQFAVLGAEGPKTYFASRSRQTLGHAYLFSGVPGVGKKTFARRLAQSLLCAENADGVLGYCGTCASCHLFESASATHPDFLEHYGSLKIGDSDGAMGFHEGEDLTSRDVVRQLMMRSYSGGMRILLLGDIEFATHHAANALLKFVEEPPDDVLLLLTTATPGKIIATIRSRVSELRFAPLTQDELVQVLTAEGVAAGQATQAAAMANGSLVRARALLRSDEETSLRSAIATWFFDVIEGRTPETGWATRETLNEGVDLVRTLARDWMVLSTQTQSPALAGDFTERLRGLHPLQTQAGVALLASLDEARAIAATNVPPAMLAERIRMAVFAAVR
ncbi:MAG: AAA family ATPase [Vulcanimicrobiaceae bacterium]